ncbi:hypothetical protein Sphch_3749 [Sphingobium chlorophenolicum L-1]|uniref:Uncharacterized protein n=2 Tax=Sphingobium chlorophenolicum TaxID=46429 RepID=F6F1B6_SPHCR|nr:hypothetical protein [Sphingobium chlorophenolicum]AEG51332.1 hypothetical protein Sphch_3749 [Sphingobium chlorophenolicum L-1]KEQ51572.1 hypothetical protein BV95_04167 [Sphingobium chlorophenolicum]
MKGWDLRPAQGEGRARRAKVGSIAGADMALMILWHAPFQRDYLSRWFNL